jgi:hypothetical protein
MTTTTKATKVNYCVHCRHAFDGVHCRARAPIVLARVNPDPAIQPPRVTWTGFPLLPLDKMGCGDFTPKEEP